MIVSAILAAAPWSPLILMPSAFNEKLILVLQVSMVSRDKSAQLLLLLLSGCSGHHRLTVDEISRSLSKIPEEIRES